MSRFAQLTIIFTIVTGILFVFACGDSSPAKESVSSESSNKSSSVSDNEGALLASMIEKRQDFESANWMLAALGLGATFLNKPSKLLSYMSSAVYPVYIVHMPIQFFFCSIIFPLSITASFKLIIVLSCTYAGSFLVYEIVKRIKWIRLLFGMKNESIKNIKSGS